MIDDSLILVGGWIAELVLLGIGIYSIYRFFTFGENSSLILGIFLSLLSILGIIYWIIKKESFFNQYFPNEPL